MGKKIRLGLLVAFAFILLDIFSRFLYSQSWFSNTTLSTEVNPVDIITLVITSGVTIWLGLYVAKKLTAQRYEKEYIITDLKQIENEIGIIERQLEVSNIEIQTMLHLLRKLKSYIDRFSKTAEIFKVNCIDADCLKEYYTEIYRKATNVEGTELRTSDPVYNEINQIFSEFIIKTREMIFRVNKH